MRYLFSEPVFGNTAPPERYHAPAGRQAELCRAVLEKKPLYALAQHDMREEWIAVLYALRQMKLDVGVAVASPVIDQSMAIQAKTQLGCLLAGLAGLPPGETAVFPRDICIRIGAKLFVSPESYRLTGKTDAVQSAIGQGGRILHRGRVALISERIHYPVANTKVQRKDLWPLGREIQTVLMPIFLSTETRSQGLSQDGSRNNDHQDRVGGLLQARDGSYHLIVDSSATWLEWIGFGAARPISDSLDHLQRICERANISVHPAPQLHIPYSINFLQTDDGRVLMTSGEAELQGMIGDLVGAENVVTTPIPIRLFPAWRFGGIRCMTADAPNELLRTIA